MATVYIVWDRKNAQVVPGSPHPTSQAATDFINRRKAKDRAKGEEGKQYDAVAVTV